MIEYTKDLSAVTSDLLEGFFVDWPNPPSQEKHLELLKSSYCSYVAVEQESCKVVGFINAVSDGVLSAYIPLLEVLPEYKGIGIGSKLVELILEELSDLYMIDICHDEELVPFYRRFGAMGSYASIFRNYAAQAGA